jgi:hypothetical protein
MKEKIAIDVGGVIIEKKDRNGADTNFDAHNVKWIPGALNAIRRLSLRFDVYILSFCGKKTEQETRAALRQGIRDVVPEDKWIFTRERRHKVDRMKELDITTLVDDTWLIISWVSQSGLRGIHFGSPQFPNWDMIVRFLESV